MAGNCYTILPKEWDHLRKGLINIQNIDDNEYFKWCLIEYLHPADDNGRRITKADKDFAKKTVPSQKRNIHKIEKRILSPLTFCLWK